MKKYFGVGITVALLLILTVENITAIASSHPRLLLTPEKIVSLKSSTATQTQLLLWELARKRADEFCQMPIPSMERADNKYRYIGDSMPVLGLTYLMTKDMQYVDAAKKWMTALLNVPDWKGSQNLGRCSWMVGCAFLYDWLYPVFDQDMKNRIKSRLVSEAHCIMAQNFSYRLLSNHCLIETSAMGLTGLALDGESDEAKAFQQTAEKWTEQIIAHAPLDGSWGEGIGYWKYGLGYFIRYLEASRTAEWKNYYTTYDWLKITGYFPIYFSLPGFQNLFFNFSDSNTRTEIPPFILYFLASTHHKGYFQDFGNRLSLNKSHSFGWLDFIMYNPGIQSEDYTRLPAFKHFVDNGFVLMRSGWEKDAVAVGFHCGPAPGHRNQKDSALIEKRGFGPGHMHPDINGFNIFAYGQWLAIDPGYTHLKQTRNHNTILVNGHGQTGEGAEWLDYLAFEKRNPVPAILRAESYPAYDYVIGDAGNIYVDEARLKTFRRHLLFLKPDIVVVVDDLEGKGVSNFEWLLNGNNPISERGEVFIFERNGIQMGVHPLATPFRKIKVTSRPLEAADTNGMIWTLTLKADSVKNVRYLTVLDIRKDRQEPELDAHYAQNHLTIQKGNASWSLEVLPIESIVQSTDPVFRIEKPKITADFDYSYVRSE